MKALVKRLTVLSSVKTTDNGCGQSWGASNDERIDTKSSSCFGCGGRSGNVKGFKVQTDLTNFTWAFVDGVPQRSGVTVHWRETGILNVGAILGDLTGSSRDCEQAANAKSEIRQKFWTFDDTIFHFSLPCSAVSWSFASLFWAFSRSKTGSISTRIGWSTSLVREGNHRK